MRRLRRRQTTYRAVLAFTVSALLATAVTVVSPRAATAVGTSPLVDLSGPDEFRKQFNEDRGHVRLVLLLSPT
jgi:hypothetical protein